MDLLFSLHDLTKRFGEREVLRIDSLEIEPDNTYALMGDNGAGKSTLMRILAFLDQPSGGELYYKGNKVAPGQLASYRPGVVWVPQFPVMFTGSLLYNLEYPLALKKVPARERRKKALELLELVKLEHLGKAPAHRLSGGESQRASIARALAAGAETILFDEPTANVDQRSLGDFISLVRDIRERQRLTVMIATHNPALAATLCRRQIFLSAGRLVKKRLLPGGEAWPGRLRPGSEAERPILQVAAQALQSAVESENREMPGPAVLCGISSVAAGTILRVEVVSGHFADILLDDSDSMREAGTLTLGTAIIIEAAGS